MIRYDGPQAFNLICRLRLQADAFYRLRTCTYGRGSFEFRFAVLFVFRSGLAWFSWFSSSFGEADQLERIPTVPFVYCQRRSISPLKVTAAEGLFSCGISSTSQNRIESPLDCTKFLFVGQDDESCAHAPAGSDSTDALHCLSSI